ncbi:peptide chain release factor 1, mitochondrial-like isoform X1 [Acipenser ruthenus]|uniref:peptide chain release factor 1, mitochondrial-like isoform X1 n=2 Tax=Acipenser ruthenus TaxID=7906 RepID=UPI002740D696|nr:peptide chain release factor 1, mitochondrial-like isoform X1 [Acipenser ruthenus]
MKETHFMSCQVGENKQAKMKNRICFIGSQLSKQRFLLAMAGAAHGSRQCALTHRYYQQWTWRRTPCGPAGLYTQQLTRRHCQHFSKELLQQESVQRYLEKMIEEYRQVTQRLNNTALTESERRTMSRRQIELSPMATVFQQSQRAVKDMKDVQAIIESAEAGEDTQMLELAKEEQKGIRKLIETLQIKLLQSLVPSDKHDASDVIVEVAAGRTTGGDICQQFTREIFEMYQNFASYKQWAFEVLNYTPAEYGGLHHAAARIAGESVYRHFKYEGGMHRVQRIPEVGLSSRMQRIHTGTMMVIVLPQPDEVDVIIEPKDLRIDTFRSKGAGGQSVNTTDSAVRLVHIPTGITVECQQERSQLQNRETAMRMLRARIYQQLIEKETEQRQSARKLQVGTRSQSERIRTYNFTQDRVTDHRISYVTRDIKEFLSGGELLEELISELLKSAETEALLELVENSRD